MPDLLLKNQTKLGLSATDLVVLINVLMHWWYADKKPLPRPTIIAKRMGVTVRTVQRSIAHMEEIGLLMRVVSTAGPTYLDPSPLVAKLNKIARTDEDYLFRTGRMNAA